MSHNPIQVARYVSLVVEEEIDKDTIKAWFKCVTDKSPYGVVSVLNSRDNEGQPQSVSLVHRETKDSHYYMVPITRDLLEYEAERIVNAWAEIYDSKDFDVEVTCIPSKPFAMPEEPSITVEQQKFADLATAFAKRQHEMWMDERVKEGWRFGQKMSVEDRTHPLLRPWEELPDRYRKVDVDQPQKLLDLLSDQGYAVVSKDDLAAIQKLLRGLDANTPEPKMLGESILHKAGEAAFKALVNARVIPILRKNPLWKEAVRVTGHETHYRAAAYIQGTRIFHVNSPAGMKAKEYANQLGTIITTLLHDADLPWTVQIQDSIYSVLKKECQSGPDGDDPVEIPGATKTAPWGSRT